MSFNKKYIIILAILCYSSAFAQVPVSSGNDTVRYQQTMLYKGLAEIIKRYHYDPPKINDELSLKLFNGYLAKLDPNKIIFLKKDIVSLDTFKLKLDDELRGQAEPLGFYTAAQQLYQQRLKEIKDLSLLTNKNWQPGFKNQILLPGDSIDWSPDAAARLVRWNKLLSYQYYIKQLDLEKGFKDSKLLHAKVLQSLQDKYAHWLNVELNKTDPYASFALYVNVLAYLVDPHTEYQPPVNKRKFDQMMSNVFYGIGLTLAVNDQGEIKVASLLTGMPAWKSHQIDTDDIILALAEGTEGQWNDIGGWDLNEIIDRIRGKEGTIIRLKIRDAKAGTIKELALLREKVSVQEAAARSGVLLSKTGKKVGVIYFPEFYNDYAHADGAKVANDVARELTLLKNQHIDALVIDLRYNGGGSLDDVVKICGYFVKYGPVVQVKDHNGKVDMLTDDDGVTLFDGPMAVLVNGYSASASEIFAAAMQDYKRALIIGTDTYGKGTVQRPLPLGRPDVNGDSPYGAIKLTTQKFYRINGLTTQKVGVHPDIYMPDVTAYTASKERNAISVLSADSIAALSYHEVVPNTDKLKERFLKEFKGTDLTSLDSLAKVIGTKPVLRIGHDAAVAQRNKLQAATNKYKNLEKMPAGSEQKTIAVGSNTTAKWYDDWLKGISSSALMEKVVRIISEESPAL